MFTVVFGRTDDTTKEAFWSTNVKKKKELLLLKAEVDRLKIRNAQLRSDNAALLERINAVADEVMEKQGLDLQNENARLMEENATMVNYLDGMTSSPADHNGAERMYEAIKSRLVAEGLIPKAAVYRET